MQTAMNETNEQYWVRVNGAVWRTARKRQQADCGKPYHWINPGDKYLDTHEHRPSQMWATIKICARCAALPS